MRLVLDLMTNMQWSRPRCWSRVFGSDSPMSQTFFSELNLGRYNTGGNYTRFGGDFSGILCWVNRIRKAMATYSYHSLRLDCGRSIIGRHRIVVEWTSNWYWIVVVTALYIRAIIIHTYIYFISDKVHSILFISAWFLANPTAAVLR